MDFSSAAPRAALAGDGNIRAHVLVHSRPMHPAAFTLAALASLPVTPLDPATLLAFPPAWPTASEILEAPSADDADDAGEELDPALARLAVDGCELTLSGSPTVEDWSRELWVGAPPPVVTSAGHTERDGSFTAYEQISRRIGRPEAYAAYVYPVADPQVVSGYDLDKPDPEQRRGKMNAIGHGGVDVVAPMGTPIGMIRLEHQKGDAEVLYVGTLYGETVVTRHAVREGRKLHDYLLIFGHLDGAGPEVRRGLRLRQGATVGYVGNSASPELIHLHLEARRMRDGLDAWKLPMDVLDVRELSIVTDPRNVLPLRSAPRRLGKCAFKPARSPRRYWLGDAMALELDPPAP